MAEKKERLMREYLSKPIEVGDEVEIPKHLIRSFVNNKDARESVKVVFVDGETISVEYDEYGKLKIATIDAGSLTKITRNVGANPFVHNAWRRRTRTINYSISSIISLLFPEISEFRKDRFDNWEINGIKVKETNFNPYVIDKEGKKQYYQRDFVWTLEEKQMLIESIYKGLNCGQIIVRTRSYKEVERAMKNGDTEICFRDIVDGKQRLNAIYEFMTDKYKDLQGNYFSDLSESAQWEFYESMAITYAEMDEGTNDDDVIAAFLNVNFTGVPQSKEHIEYVEKIAELMK